MRRIPRVLILLAVLLPVAVPTLAQPPRIVDVVVPDDPAPRDGQRVTVPVLVALENPGDEALRVELAPDFGEVAEATENAERRLEPGERITVALPLVVDLTGQRRGGERMLGGALLLLGDGGRELGRHPLALLVNRGRRALPEKPAQRQETMAPPIARPAPLRIDPSAVGSREEPMEVRPEAMEVATGVRSGSSLGFVTAAVTDTYRTRAARQDRRFLKALKLLVQLENRGPEPWNAPFTLRAEVERSSPAGGRGRYGKQYVEKVELDEALEPGEALNLTLVLGQRVPGFGLVAEQAPGGVPAEARFFPRPVLVYEEALGWYGGESFTVRLVLDAPRDKDPSDNGLVFTGTVGNGLDLDTRPAQVHAFRPGGTTTTTRPRDTP